MKYLAPIPKQFVDQNGLPLSNGTVHVYISGDTQYANVYQDADGEELMPNPARLDSNGAWLGFVTAGVPLDYVVEDKDGNVQFEYEKVVAGSGTANVAIEPVLTSGTKIAECWVDGELLELFAPDDGGSSYTASTPIVIDKNNNISNNGTNLTCTGTNAWAEGLNTTASGEAAHSEGKSNEATGNYSHVEGQLCKAKGQASHAGGQSCETSGQNSFAHGAYLKTSNQSSCQAAFGMYNSDQKAMFVIGNGTAENNRKDVFKVDSNGDTWVTIGGVLTKVTNVSGGGGGGDQVMLVRSNMTSDFTDTEYQDCVDAVTAEKAVCVQFELSGSTIQAQLTMIMSDGTLVFEFSAQEYHFRYEVSPTASAHSIAHTITVPARESDIAPEWSSADVPTYGIDTIVYHDYWLYRCKVSNPSNTWVSGEWEQVDLATILDIMRQTGWYGITPMTSVSAGFRIKPDGSVESAAGYTLNRYYIVGLGGKTIRISSDYNSVFSTTDSASGKVSLGLAAGEYVIPASANYLIVSHTQGSTFDVSVKDFDAVPSNSRSRIHLTYYDSSVGYKIDSSGNAVADANYTLFRYHTDGVPNRTLDIETNGYSVFSTSGSASNRVTPALSAGSYVVPTNGTYLIISVKTGDPFDVWLVTDEPYVSKYGTYGLQMKWSENTTYRLGDAVNKSFSVDNATGEVTSDFDTCYPWCDMKLCNIENPNGLRTITYQGEAGFTFSKDTYVEVPKFYFKRVYDPNTEFEYWFISSKGGDGFELEPWFRNADGSEAQVRYVARYNLASSGNISRTGYAAYWNLSKSVLKTYCESNNVKLMDIHAYQALIHLFVIESGTKDSQSFFKGVSYFRYFTEQTNQQMTNSSGTTNTIVIPTTDGRNEYFGVGDRVAIFQTASNDFNEAIIRNLTAVSYGGGSATLTFDGAPISLTQGVSRIYGISQLNGRTDGISTVSGRTVDGDEHTRSFSYRGIENLWGNLGELVDGITYDYDNHRFKVGNEYLTFETPINRTYIEDTSVPRWIKYFGVDARYPGLTLPCSPLTQTPSTSYTDEWSTFGNESGISDISYGCAWDHRNANGVMCFRNVRDTGNILYTGRAML